MAGELGEAAALVVALAGATDDDGAFGSTKATVHVFASCTKASPFAPVTGVNTIVHACIIGPEPLWS